MAVADINPADEDADFLPLTVLQRQVSDYRGSKAAERDESEEADRYYHADQWTSDEVATQNERGQPVVTYNRTQRKIDGIVGLVERLRQDPKAYPRTPKHEDGAEIATNVLNYALDRSRWKDISPSIARDAALGPLGGVELELVPGDEGDPDLRLHPISRRRMFYDPRAKRDDFSDARYMGFSDWLDLDVVQGMFPDRAAELKDIATGGDAGAWYAEQGRPARQSNERSIWLVEHWYVRRGLWRFAFYAGTLKLDEGISPYPDPFGEGRNGPRFIMFSANVDHDGDRYGFHRNLKGPQDEINHRRAKGMHLLHSRQMTVKGAIDDATRDTLRAEGHKPDGVLDVPSGAEVAFADNSAQAKGNLEMMLEAKNEIENFGPNPALIGQGIEAKSGRAIALLQQAGIAELGPFLIAYRAFKTRVYRTVWAAIQEHWKGERWVRVTDDEGLTQFLSVNSLTNPDGTPRLDEYGRPVIANVLGSLDVDLIVDEGPDQVNSMADAFDILVALAQQGAQVPPEIILELSSLPASVKKRVLAALQQAKQPNPMAVEAAKAELAGKAADVDLTRAQTAKTMSEAAQGPGMGHNGGPAMERPDPIDVAQRAAEVDLTRAKTAETTARAQAAAAKPHLEVVRTADQRRRDANATMLDLARLEQQAAARPGVMDSGYMAGMR